MRKKDSKFPNNASLLVDIQVWIGFLHAEKKRYFSNFSCMFLNPNNFFQISKILQILGLQPRISKVFLDH